MGSAVTLADALHVADAHTVALCGAGGKTTLLYALAEQARQRSLRVLVTTSTHLFQPQSTATRRFYDQRYLRDIASVCIPAQISVVGTPCGNKKITGLHPATIAAAMQAADVFLYEGDGSRRLPVKCHNRTEPVIWPNTDAVICVLGLSAFGKPAQQVCHRWQLDCVFAQHSQALLDAHDFVRLALECRTAAGSPHQFSVCFNQCDTDAQLTIARACAQQLALHGIPCAASCFLGAQCEITAL